MESFDLVFATMTVNKYVCATCWGDLETVRDPRDVTKHFVLCRKCKEETRGYVTKYFANRRRSESEGEKIEATKLLRSIGVLPKPEKKSIEELKNSLGFGKE